MLYNLSYTQWPTQHSNLMEVIQLAYLICARLCMTEMLQKYK